MRFAVRLYLAIATACSVAIALNCIGCRQTPSVATPGGTESKLQATAGAPRVAPAQSTCFQIADLSLASLEQAAGHSLSELANTGRRLVDSATLALSTSLFMVSDPDTCVARLNRFIYRDLGVVFDGDRRDILSDHPYTALAQKRGSCLGIGMLYLLFARKLDLPIQGVVVPGHFFVRYTSASRRINIEALKGGEHRDDSWYREKFGITDSSWYTLNDLSCQQVGAVLHFNIGNTFLARHNHAAAAQAFLRVVDIMPQYAEAWGNLGIAWNALGRYEQAVNALEQARAISPAIDNVSRNLAAMLVRQKRYDEAAKEYDRALRLQPADTALLYGVAYAHFMAGSYGEATRAAGMVLSVHADHAGALALLSRARALEHSGNTSRQGG